MYMFFSASIQHFSVEIKISKKVFEHGRKPSMKSVRMLVGTRKGAFILNSDGMRKNWKIAGPYFGGWEIYPMKGSPIDPDRIYASQTSSWFGQVIQRSDDGGQTWEALSKGLPQRDCYVNILRDAMAVDSLDSCGVYFGTTGGQAYASSNSGDDWLAIVRDLPPVLSVEVQTLA
jgi:hypothetical protein